MVFVADMKRVREGITELFVPMLSNNSAGRGPGTRNRQVFYNPVMELNRDLSVLMAQWLVSIRRCPPVLLDGLAASGVRGVRFACEVDGDFDVVINDWDDQAFSLIEKNIQHNDLRNAVAYHCDLNVLLSEGRYDYVDVDPFGSPVSFVDSAVRSLFNSSVLACTATDAAALCGVYPKVCLRRYGAVPFHSWTMHEVGLRILIGFIVREAAKYDKGVEPLLCCYIDHYFRVYVRLLNGVRHAHESLQKMACISVDSKGMHIGYAGSGRMNIGPLWVGNLHDKVMLNCLRDFAFDKQLNTKKRLLRLLDLFDEEADAPPFYYTVDAVASLLKISPPKMQDLFQRLKDRGFMVRRTHFSGTGFKTNASFDEIKNVFVALRKEY